MKFWIIRKGTTTMKLRAADIFAARSRAAAGLLESIIRQGQDVVIVVGDKRTAIPGRG